MQALALGFFHPRSNALSEHIDLQVCEETEQSNHEKSDGCRGIDVLHHAVNGGVLNGTITSDAIPDSLYHFPAFLIEFSGVNSRVSATMTDLSLRFYKLFLQRSEQVLLSVDTLRSPDTVPNQPAIKMKLYERTSTQLDSSGKEIQSLYSLRMLRKIGHLRENNTSVPQVNRDAGYIEIEDEGNERHRLQFTAPKTGWYLVEITPKDSNSLGAYKISVTKTSSAQQVLQHVCQ